MSLYACLFGVIITVFQVGRNPTSGEWTFPFFILKSRTLTERMNEVVSSFTVLIYLLRRQSMEIEHSDSLLLLPYYKRLFKFRPAAFLPSRHCDLMQSTLPDRLMKYCCVLSCAVLCCRPQPGCAGCSRVRHATWC